MTAHQEISRPDKTLFADPGLTKADLARYNEQVADHSGFFQKQASPDAPVDTVTVAAHNARGHVEGMRKPDPWADIAAHAGSVARARAALG